MVIGIIGAGASGMAAAIAASENTNTEVIVFERQARVGRKLQATGNGRCNLTNIHAIPSSYLGDAPGFAEAALSRFDAEETIRWFRGLGLYSVTEASGRVYPYSDQANSVVDVLRFALMRENIRLLTGVEITKIHRKDGGFLVQSMEDTFFCDRLIVACGGLAGTKLGGSMSGYQLLRSLGHGSTKLRPSLVQIKTGWSGVASLKGVRAGCKASIFRDGELHCESTGELQFTDYGLSGPVIFEISRDVCFGKGQWVCRLDFLPEVELCDLKEELSLRRQRDLPVEELLTGILHNRLGRVLTKDAGIAGSRRVSSLTDSELDAACHAVKAFEVNLTEPMGMDSAQVTAGGVKTDGFDPETMESKLVPGLYACGEVLDIDGPCGGYNLQWAWSSGRLAGLSAGREKT
ncbi:MAG: NAD(P)/FAD-dependent oxidoreductase [Faecousia sp.]